MVTSQSTVTDTLEFSIHFSSKLLVSVYATIYGVYIKWNYCTHGLSLKLELGNDGLFLCELELMI